MALLHDDRGMTLIEVMIAITILVVGILALMNTVTTGYLDVAFSGGESTATAAARPPLTMGPVVEATGIDAGTTRQAGYAAGGTVLHRSVEAALGGSDGLPSRKTRRAPRWARLPARSEPRRHGPAGCC